MRVKPLLSGAALATVLAFGGTAAVAVTTTGPAAVAATAPAATSNHPLSTTIPCTIGGVASTCKLVVAQRKSRGFERGGSSRRKSNRYLKRLEKH